MRLAKGGRGCLVLPVMKDANQQASEGKRSVSLSSSETCSMLDMGMLGLSVQFKTEKRGGVVPAARN